MHSLHGDGICEELYHHLWCKDEQDRSPSVRVPDTIVYKYGQPVHWYFTGQDGQLKKKLKNNVINAKIEDAFVNRAVGDIVGYYISWDAQDPPGTTQSIEYFNAEGLHNFLFGRAKQHNGILQRFIEPKGRFNSMVRAAWSPKLCLVERRINRRPLHDIRFGLHERAITYDGPEIHSKASPLRGSILPTAVQAACESAVRHISEVSFREHMIRRAVIYFKLDSRDRLWLLWSSSIREANSKVSGISKSLNMCESVRVPPHIPLRSEPDHSGNPDSLRTGNRVSCPSCGALNSPAKLHAVSYKTVIDHFEHALDLCGAEPEAAATGVIYWPPSLEVIVAAGGIGFGDLSKVEAPESESVSQEDVSIPPVLRKAHPRLAADAYARHRRDPLFLYKTVAVCETCYLGYAGLANASLRAASRNAVTDMALCTLTMQSTINEGTGWVAGGHKSGQQDASQSWVPTDDDLKRKASTRRRGDELRATVIREGAAPRIPPPIRNGTGALEWSQHIVPASTGNIHSMSDSVPMSPRDLVRQREEAFFKEMGGGSGNGPPIIHPLSHLIASKRKLEASGLPAVEIDPSTALQKLRDSLSPHASPYCKPQMLVEYVGHSSLKPSMSTSTISWARGTKSNDIPKMSSQRQTGIKGASTLSKSAIKHREFLTQTLDKVRDQLEVPAPPPLQPCDDEMLGTEQKGITG
jgi:hypothetical protein